MAMAGYSGTPLVKKLGIKAGSALYLYKPPNEYFDWVSPMPEKTVVRARLTGQVDFVHIFALHSDAFQREFDRCQKHLHKDGMLWVSWPKKSSKIRSDLDENIIRDYGLKRGLVDVKVCAVSDIWSGLKFVIRLKDR